MISRLFPLLLLAAFLFLFMPCAFSEETATVSRAMDTSNPLSSPFEETPDAPAAEIPVPEPSPKPEDREMEKLLAEREAFEDAYTEIFVQIRKLTDEILNHEISGNRPERLPSLRQELYHLKQEQLNLIKTETNLELREKTYSRRQKSSRRRPGLASPPISPSF